MPPITHFLPLRPVAYQFLIHLSGVKERRGERCRGHAGFQPSLIQPWLHLTNWLTSDGHTGEATMAAPCLLHRVSTSAPLSSTHTHTHTHTHINTHIYAVKYTWEISVEVRTAVPQCPRRPFLLGDQCRIQTSLLYLKQQTCIKIHLTRL